ncbi:MAG: Gfo/Idh/MocA family oxidoreductase, partial [Prosthecobacter sp.]|nr:Gfo/Idh/MocA family oxidoreductase [Prosthecobacter sp.]
MNTPLSSRRHFLKTAGAIAAASAAPSVRAVAANDKISVACIGIRGRGNSVMSTFIAEPDCEVTHLCDVREAVLAQRGAEVKAKTGKMPKLVKDYRDLLSDPSIDAFMVATPDHWHALLTIEGCLAGKDVYVEKPASHNILEGKVAVAAARKKDRMVQMGTQIRSAKFLHEAREFVKSGALGKVISGRAWETARTNPVKLAANGAPPDGIDYHLWQGPSPERAYNSTIVEGAWRWLFDYGTGDLGNDGVHRIDYCRHVMGLDTFPDAISSSGGKMFFDDDQQFPDTLFVNYDYPGHVIQYEMRLWS